MLQTRVTDAYHAPVTLPHGLQEQKRVTPSVYTFFYHPLTVTVATYFPHLLSPSFHHCFPRCSVTIGPFHACQPSLSSPPVSLLLSACISLPSEATAINGNMGDIGRVVEIGYIEKKNYAVTYPPTTILTTIITTTKTTNRSIKTQASKCGDSGGGGGGRTTTTTTTTIKEEDEEVEEEQEQEEQEEEQEEEEEEEEEKNKNNKDDS
ncbi:hypothetical protein E2C01_038895 [Portunus trituberculatus]|uniref:Uncharacterized protein n=1 Tax=Portunus trituberculatus TaxID=210409 RepID=A0A5B7FJ87_PORTR|nr:hypothetical protein [Portunus trituberculatus]